MLTPELAKAFARVALANVQREYPRRLDQLLVSAQTEWRPKLLHPAFYGSYDWHSAVHMHWLLAHLLRLHPTLENEIAPALNAHLTRAAIEKELAFFSGPGAATFERPYGWAWLLKLQAELLELKRWHDAVAPLATELSQRMLQYLSKSPHSVSSG